MNVASKIITASVGAIAGTRLNNVLSQRRDMLARIFALFVIAAGLAPELSDTRERMAVEDRGAVIGARALAGDDPACVRAAELFVGLYGAEAGNLALKGLAQGGVYLAGGIAPKILPVLREGEFLRRFQDKGRFGALLASMPVHVITNAKVGLLGAALCAADSAQRSTAPSIDLARA